MKSPEYDEIDALLANIDDVSSIDILLDDEEVDEVDALLGGIDDDFITPKEKIFLSNKQYLEDTPQAEIDENFIRLQDELISNVEDILEDYSGGSMTGEHFGLDQEYDELDALESELDDMLLGLDLPNGECHECGSHNVHDEDCSEFGGIRSRIARRNQRAVINRQLRKNRRQLRKEGKMAQRGIRRTIRAERKSIRREARNERKSEAFVASKRRYLRLVTSFKKACLKFRKLRIRKAQQKNAVALVEAPAAMAIAPFSVMTAGMVSSFHGVMDTMDEAFGLAKPGVVSRVQKRRRERQILRAAKACDQKYRRLVKVWKKLNRLGNTAGLQSPQQIVGQSGGWLKDVARKARKVRMTRSEKTRLRRAKLISKRKLKALREERKRARRYQLKRRQSIVSARVARQQALAEQRKHVRQDRRDAKAEARSEYDALLAQTSYIDEADLAALERAAIERKKSTFVKPRAVLPAALVGPVIPRVIKSKPRIPRRKRPLIKAKPLVIRRRRRPVRKPRPVRSVVRPPVRPIHRPLRPIVHHTRPVRSVGRPVHPLVRPVPTRPSVRPVFKPAPRTVPSPIAYKAPTHSSSTRFTPVPAPNLRRPQSSVSKKADLEKKIKVAQQKLDATVKLHRQALDSKQKAEMRGLNSVIVQSHYADVKKYAQQSTDLREVLNGYKIQLSLLGRR
jgi:hypothetical protein